MSFALALLPVCNVILCSLLNYPLGIILISRLLLYVFLLPTYWLKHLNGYRFVYLWNLARNDIHCWFIYLHPTYRRKPFEQDVLWSHYLILWYLFDHQGHIILQAYLFMQVFYILLPLSNITIDVDWIIFWSCY